MFNKCVSFMYDGTCYITTLDGDFVQESFPSGNATPRVNAMSARGLMMAVSQPWKVNSPTKIPEVEVDKIERINNNTFLIEGLLSFEGKTGIYTLTPDTQTWEFIEETPAEPEPSMEVNPTPQEPKEPVVESPVTVEEPSVTVEEPEPIVPVEPAIPTDEPSDDDVVEEDIVEEIIEEPPVVVEEAPVLTEEEDAIEESEEPVSDIKEPVSVEEPKVILIGGARVRPISFGVTMHRAEAPSQKPRRVPVSLGVAFGDTVSLSPITSPVSTESEEAESIRVVEVPKTAQEIIEGAAVSNPQYVYVVNSEVKERAEEEKDNAADVFNIRSLSGKELLAGAEDLEEDVHVSPIKASVDFDADTFLSQLLDEQRAVLEKIPKDCLNNTIEEYTTKEINRDEVLRLGTSYCIMNKWHVHGDWYFIDVTPHMSRFFYNETENLAVEIPLSIFKKWRMYLESVNG